MVAGEGPDLASGFLVVWKTLVKDQHEFIDTHFPISVPEEIRLLRGVGAKEPLILEQLRRAPGPDSVSFECRPNLGFRSNQAEHRVESPRQAANSEVLVTCGSRGDLLVSLVIGNLGFQMAIYTLVKDTQAAVKVIKAEVKPCEVRNGENGFH